MQGLDLQNGNKDNTIFGGGWTWPLSVGSPYFFLRCVGLGLHGFQRCFVTGRGLGERRLHKLGAGIPLEVNQWNGLWKKHSCVYKTKPAECIYNEKENKSHPVQFVLQVALGCLQTGVLLHQRADLTPDLSIQDRGHHHGNIHPHKSPTNT